MNIHGVQSSILSEIDVLDARILLSFVLKKPGEYVIAHPEHVMRHSETARLRRYAKRRKNGEPIALILKKKEFYGRTFTVNKHTLVPRPETELMVELGTKIILQVMQTTAPSAMIMDVGTGSGCIIISLIKEIGTILQRSNIRYIASDKSTHALSVARKNATFHNALNALSFFRSDLFQNSRLKSKIKNAHCSTMFVFANLPYVPKKYIEKNPTPFSVGLLFEPKIALDGGKDGMEIYTRFFNDLADIVPKNILLFCFFEIDPNQQYKITKRINNAFHLKLKSIRFFKDLAGNTRTGLCEIQT